MGTALIAPGGGMIAAIERVLREAGIIDPVEDAVLEGDTIYDLGVLLIISVVAVLVMFGPLQ